VSGADRVELGMYSFPRVASAWQALWSAVHARVPWTPELLTPTDDVHAGWRDEACIVSHICGGPLVTVHRNEWDVVGAFSLDVPHAGEPAHYRSVLLSRFDRPLESLVTPTTQVVANSADSLSGWTSLVFSTGGPGSSWPGAATFTGSHLASVIALANGIADLASIDGWSLALIVDERPDIVADLHVVGLGPLVPTPAIAARRTLAESRLNELRAAWRDAVSDPTLVDALATLHITGFVPLEFEDYEPIRRLQPTN
jgi:ABC-type phosphate/phosphonate transport system substrate-binding protein